MLGAIIGDIVGSRFEFDDYKGKEFDLFGMDEESVLPCGFTDDSVITVAVADALLNMDCNAGDDAFKKLLIEKMHHHGRKRIDAGYGNRFLQWLKESSNEPYNSYGNGSAMRVAPVGWVSEFLEETEHLAKLTAEVTHNHLEGIKGAQATAAAIWMARHGKTKDEIREYVESKYYPDAFSKTLDEIRPDYNFDESCQGTVPVSLVAFYEANSFEDAIRNAISVGGDSDTLTDITGGVAEAFYGIPKEISEKAITFLDEEMVEILEKFQLKYMKEK